MKGSKWICCVLALVLLLGGILPLQAYAIDHIDEDRLCSLEITSKYNAGEENEINLVGAEFKLYRIATPDIQCNLTATDDYAKFLENGGWDLNNLKNSSESKPGEKTWQDLNEALMKAVLGNKNLKPDEVGYTDDNGVAKFTNLPQGLYLILGSPHTQDKVTYEQNPILLMSPDRFSGESWTYDRVGELGIKNKPGIAKNALRVEKIWDDHDNAANLRPETLTIHLVCEDDPSLNDTITLPDKDGKWEYTWQLEYGHTWYVYEETEGMEERYYVCKDPVQGTDGTTLIVWKITNKYVPPKLPQTGQLWWPVPVLLSLGLLCLLVGMLRRRGEKHEA